MVNNDYTHWEMYAIGGSASPTINSQGNRYLAPVNPFAKEVGQEKRFLLSLCVFIDYVKSSHLFFFPWLGFGQVTHRVEQNSGVWKHWNWRSDGDLMLNGAYFRPSGRGASASYARASSLAAKSSSMVGMLTSGSGALSCRRGSRC